MQQILTLCAVDPENKTKFVTKWVARPKAKDPADRIMMVLGKDGKTVSVFLKPTEAWLIGNGLLHATTIAAANMGMPSVEVIAEAEDVIAEAREVAIEKKVEDSCGTKTQ